MVMGTVELLINTCEASRSGEPRFYLSGSEIQREIRKRSRNALVSASTHVLNNEENDRVAIDAVKLLLTLRAQLCESGDETI